MVIVQLNGGLGNQLFQYAAGRRLAEKHKTELMLDLTKFSLDDVRPHELYGLHSFNIKAEIADMPELKQFYANNFWGKIKRKTKTMLGIGKIKRVCEKKHFVFDPTIPELPDNVYLWGGYWQSEKYFKDIEDIIRVELALKNDLTPQSAVIERQIRDMQNTVSLHIRRGDYVTDAGTNSVLGLCPLDYYQKCISILENELGRLNIFVFSDDPDWVKKNLQSGNNLCFVENNNVKYAFEDIYLMSICKHNIIANSSFSWWGAWLNKNKNKKVFAPNQWIRNAGSSMLDIIPDNWNKL